MGKAKKTRDYEVSRNGFVLVKRTTTKHYHSLLFAVLYRIIRTRRNAFCLLSLYPTKHSITGDIVVCIVVEHRSL